MYTVFICWSAKVFVAINIKNSCIRFQHLVIWLAVVSCHDAVKLDAAIDRWRPDEMVARTFASVHWQLMLLARHDPRHLTFSYDETAGAVHTGLGQPLDVNRSPTRSVIWSNHDCLAIGRRRSRIRWKAGASIYYWLYCPRATVAQHDRQQFVDVGDDAHNALVLLPSATVSRRWYADFATCRDDSSPEMLSSCSINPSKASPHEVHASVGITRWRRDVLLFVIPFVCSFVCLSPETIRNLEP